MPATPATSATKRHSTSAMSLLLLASMCCGHITRLLYGCASLIYACQMTHLYAGLLICVSAFESRVIRIQTVLNSVLSTVNSVLQCVAQCVASRNASNTCVNSPQRMRRHFDTFRDAPHCNILQHTEHTCVRYACHQSLIRVSTVLNK